MINENRVIKELLEQEESRLAEKLKDKTIGDYINIERYYNDIKKLRIKYTDKASEKKDSKLTEAKRQQAIENFKKSIKKSLGYNKELQKGQKNGDKVYYIDGFMIYQTNDNIGLEVRPESESINCERIFYTNEKTQKRLTLNYTDILDFIKKSKAYKKNNNKSELWKIYPIQNDNITIYANIDYLKSMMEMTQSQNIRVGDADNVIIFENEKHEGVGLITPVKAKGKEAEYMQKYETIKNYNF